MREKACFMLQAMEQHMAALGFGWADVTATQAYTDFDIHPLMAVEFVRRRAISGGLTWHFARPPVQGRDFEMCTRRRPRIGDLTRRASAKGSADRTLPASSVSAISPRISPPAILQLTN